MTRRKPVSAKQHKAEIQLKRAIKRGDVDPEPKKAPPKRKGRRGPTGRVLDTASEGPGVESSREAANESARKLQSTFMRMSPEYLEQTKILAGSLLLPRPIPGGSSLFPVNLVATSSTDNCSNQKTISGGEEDKQSLVCPKRPKWRFDQSKKEVEKNEEGMHRKWLSQTDSAVEEWRRKCDGHEELESPTEMRDGELTTMPKSPTFFERNLEVWRQLCV
jgi:hypothetical protein